MFGGFSSRSVLKMIVRTLSNTCWKIHLLTSVFNNENEENWKINEGLRQGGFLSPLLFHLYIKGYFEVLVC